MRSTASGAASPRLLPLLALFFLSGAAALVYEVVWTRQLGLVLGVGAEAVSTVLATFMAGLALGSALAPRLMRGRHPLAFYAVAEAAVAVLGAASPFLIGALPDVFVPLARTFGEGPLLGAARAALAGAVLLPATILMGATLPALAQWASLRGTRLGASIGLLYGVNTLGAVAGTLGAAFFLVELLGRRGTILAAAAVNLGVALLAGALARRASAETGPESFTSPPGPASASRPAVHQFGASVFGARVRSSAILAGALAGATALASESLWTRYLVYSVGDNSAYAFAEMLAMTLLGIGAGSALAAPFLDRMERPLAVLGRLLGLAAIACVASVSVLEAPGRYAGLGDWQGASAPWSTFVTHGLLASARVVLVPAMLFGAAFAVVARVAATDARGAGRGVGRALAANTMGAIAGALAGGFLLLPGLGLAKGMIAAALLALGASVVAWRAEPATRRSMPLLVGLLALFAAACGFALSREDAAVRALLQGSPRDRLVFYADGAVSSVGVVEDARTGHRTLFVDGDGQAGDGPEMMLHLRLLGHLPALLHEDPRSALVIGLGAGITVGALASHPLETLQVCELSPTILRMHREGWFEAGSGGVLSDPRLRVVVADGRNHLLASDRLWDVITTDPIDPDDAGVSNLYAREFYELVAARLAPGGVACQWITQSYGPEVTRSLIEAFRGVFADCVLFDAGFTTVLAGRKRGGTPADYARLERAFDDAHIARSLAEVGIDGPEDLLALQLAGPEALAAFCAGAVPNTDDRPVAEVVAPRTTWGVSATEWVERARTLYGMRSLDRAAVVADWSETREHALAPAFEAMTRALASRLVAPRERPEDVERAPRLVLRSLVAPAPRYVDLMAGFDECEVPAGTVDAEFDRLFGTGIAALDLAPGTPATDARAVRKFEEALALRPQSLRASFGLAVAHAQAGSPALAIDAAMGVLRRARNARDVLEPFALLQVDRLVAAAAEPGAAGASARGALEALAGSAAGAGGWDAWWSGARARASLDEQAGRIELREEE